MYQRLQTGKEYSSIQVDLEFTLIALALTRLFWHISKLASPSHPTTPPILHRQIF
jgi:hypothetical protein